ncbi:MAG: helix-turn-helix domain-containing protein [Eubacteriales bacterium]|jgi:transcriptional regulator with XRE-family HTH domain
MTIREKLNEKNMSVYRLAKVSELPYATVNDICSGKAQLEKCSAETIYKIARALDVSMEELLAPCFIKRSSFENFKSTVCHRVKELGDIDFIIDTLERRDIRKYYDRKWYPESLYLLAMLDYISRENNVPLDIEYDDLRRCKLEKPVYPAGLRAVSAAAKNDIALKEAVKTAIPEFMRFNIVESDVRNVI